MAAIVDGNIEVTASVTVDGTAHTATVWAIQDTSVPTMTITASQGNDGFTSTDSTLSLTFTSSQATTTFAASDISVGNGAISNFASSSSTVYTATFTPTAAGATTIDVGAGGYSDLSLIHIRRCRRSTRRRSRWTPDE